MEKTEQEKKVIEVLKTFGKLPTARISAIVGIGYNYIKDILSNLESEGIIESEKAGELATYWKLIEANKNE